MWRRRKEVEEEDDKAHGIGGGKRSGGRGRWRME